MVGPEGDAGPEADTVDGALCACRAVPHSWQNFAAAGSSDPQLEHGIASALPHSWQNLAAAGFSC